MLHIHDIETIALLFLGETEESEVLERKEDRRGGDSHPKGDGANCGNLPAKESAIIAIPPAVLMVSPGGKVGIAEEAKT